MAVSGMFVKKALPYILIQSVIPFSWSCNSPREGNPLFSLVLFKPDLAHAASLRDHRENVVLFAYEDFQQVRAIVIQHGF